MAKTKANKTGQIGQGLAPLQIQAIELMLAGKRITEIAEELGISRSTIYRWFETPEFSETFNKLCYELLKEAETKILALIGRAIEVLEELLSEDDPNIRFKTASLILRGAGILNGERKDLGKRSEFEKSICCFG